jgi:hypothetical protein
MQVTLSRSVASLLLAVSLLFGTAPLAEAGKERSQECSVASLSGSFGYTVTGTLNGGSFPGHFAAVGRLSFDGKGNFQNIRTLNRNGNITHWVEGDGTYTLNPDCTGNFEFTEGGVVTQTTDIVVDDDGNEVRMVTTSPGTVLTVQGRKQFPKQGGEKR